MRSLSSIVEEVLREIAPPRQDTAIVGARAVAIYTFSSMDLDLIKPEGRSSRMSRTSAYTHTSRFDRHSAGSTT